jgi:hypothetical protein
MNGWIPKELWIYYTLLFSDPDKWASVIFAPELTDSDIVLIIDGHKSRLNFTAALIFPLNGIDVIMLLAHSSHLLQMFDVIVATPLERAFKLELD